MEIYLGRLLLTLGKSRPATVEHSNPISVLMKFTPFLDSVQPPPVLVFSLFTSTFCALHVHVLSFVFNLCTLFSALNIITSTFCAQHIQFQLMCSAYLYIHFMYTLYSCPLSVLSISTSNFCAQQIHIHLLCSTYTYNF